MVKLGTLDPKYLLFAGLAIAGLYVVARSAGKLPGALSEAASSVGRAIDPTSTENLAYRGASAVVGVLTGDENETLGGWLYDLTHRDPTKVVATPPLVPGIVQPNGSIDYGQAADSMNGG